MAERDCDVGHVPSGDADPDVGGGLALPLPTLLDGPTTGSDRACSRSFAPSDVDAFGHDRLSGGVCISRHQGKGEGGPSGRPDRGIRSGGCAVPKFPSCGPAARQVRRLQQFVGNPR